MLDNQFIEQGFRFIGSNYYLDESNLPYIHDLKKIFELQLEADGSSCRKRAYLKFDWDRKTDQLTLSQDQRYFQTSASNVVDGGKARQFKTMSVDILQIPVIESIITKNIDMIKDYLLLKNEKSLTIGMHFIRYQVAENGASYSSPDWLHIDDEPLVFVHLINLSKTAIGGDNLIASADNKTVTHVVRLENDIDTLVLNKSVYHAVTPLGSRKGISLRDVILFTVEPRHTQFCYVEGECA